MKVVSDGQRYRMKRVSEGWGMGQKRVRHKGRG